MGQNQSHQVGSGAAKNGESSSSSTSTADNQGIYPTPKGNEYDQIDQLQAELPSMIDEESQQQVDDYLQACDGGKGPVVACFASAEYLSMFQRKHSAAFELFENVCCK